MTIESKFHLAALKVTFKTVLLWNFGIRKLSKNQNFNNIKFYLNFNEIFVISIG